MQRERRTGSVSVYVWICTPSALQGRPPGWSAGFCWRNLDTDRKETSKHFMLDFYGVPQCLWTKSACDVKNNNFVDCHPLRRYANIFNLIYEYAVCYIIMTKQQISSIVTALRGSCTASYLSIIFIPFPFGGPCCHQGEGWYILDKSQEPWFHKVTDLSTTLELM